MEQSAIYQFHDIHVYDMLKMFTSNGTMLHQRALHVPVTREGHLYGRRFLLLLITANALRITCYTAQGADNVHGLLKYFTPKRGVSGLIINEVVWI